MLTLENRRLAFLVLATPFFLNDIGFIALDGSYGVYLVDYVTRVFVIFVCFTWPISRKIIKEKHTTNSRWDLLLFAVIFLPVVGRSLYNLIELPFVAMTGWYGLFHFGQINNFQLYWLDLTLGLFLVALSEELVFRKLALSWFLKARRPISQIVVISACFFSLMHWGSGLGRVLFTFVIGIIYMMAYLKLRKLWPLILAHWIEDFIGFGPI